MLTIAHNSSLQGSGHQAMQQFIGLIILKAEVAGYAHVFQIASLVIMAGSFLAFLIRVPKETTASGEVVVLD